MGYGWSVISNFDGGIKAVEWHSAERSEAYRGSPVSSNHIDAEMTDCDHWYCGRYEHRAPPPPAEAPERR